jgi:sugar phosphate isomerase/epimerase
VKIALSSGSLFTLPLEKIFEIARDTGFDGIEVIISYDFQYQDNLALLRELSQILRISSLHAPFMELDGWGNKIEQLTRTVELALATGIPLVNFHPPAWLSGELKFLRWLNSIDDLQKELGQSRIQIAMENMPASGLFKVNPYFFSQTPRLIQFLEERNIFLTFDTAHMGSTKTNFLHDFHLLYDTGRIRNIHFSDFGQGREHLLPGHGILPLTRFLNHLRETGYNRTLTLELTPAELPKDEAGIRETLSEVFHYLCLETRSTDTASTQRQDPQLSFL